MSLAYTSFAWDTATTANASGDVTSTSRTYNSGEMVVANYCAADNANAGNLSIQNSGTAQTWVPIGAPTNAGSDVKVAAWYCIMSLTQAMTVTVLGDAAGNTIEGAICIVVHTGQHATTPVPAGNVFSNDTTPVGSTSQAITPTSSGSCLWMMSGDWAAGNTFAPVANCSTERTNQNAAQQTVTLIRPTTQPRPDANSFTIGYTVTGTATAFLAYEIQAAAGGGGGSMIDDSANEWNPLEAQTNPLLVAVW